MELKKVILIVSLAAVFGLGFMFNTQTAQAQTATELQALIAQLQAQIAQLQKRLAQIQGVPAVWCHDFNVTLKYGDRGDEVSALQTALKKQGLLSDEEIATESGYFGESTAAAMVDFQLKYKDEISKYAGYSIRASGVFGKGTRAKLNELYGCEKPILLPVLPEKPISVCIQVITPAQNPQTKECKDFPTPCDVPAGWVKVSTCPITTTPFITVLSPNGGERWVVGETYTITWKHNLAGNYEAWIDLFKGRKFYGPITGMMPPLPNAQNITSYVWRAGDTIGGVGEGSDYQVSITYKDVNTGKMLTDTSDNYFSIVEATTAYITVLSPNGGERWVKGQTYDVKWENKGIKNVNILLIDYRAPESCYLNPLFTCPIGEPTTSGKCTPVPLDAKEGHFTISNLATVKCKSGMGEWKSVEVSLGDRYKIKIEDADNPSVSDFSDNYFSIVAATTIVPTLNVSLDVFTPASATLKPGQKDVTFAKIKITASEYPVNNMNGIHVGSDSVNASTFLTNFKVYDGATLLASSVGDLIFNGSYYYRWLNVNGFSVPAYSSKVLSVVADVKSTAQSGSVRLGAGWNFNPPGVDVVPFGTIIYGNNMSISSIPTITVLSPNGGERWVVGQTYPIQILCSQGISKVLNISLRDDRAGSSYTTLFSGVTCRLGETSNYYWTIPSSIQPGDAAFKVRVETLDSSIVDESDNYFSIISATTACTDSDGGKDYYVKGTCVGRPNIYTNEVMSLTDQCDTPRSDWNYNLIEYACGYVENVLIAVPYAYKCPNGCYDGSCISTTTPSITVLSPNGGEKWVVGNTYEIKWEHSLTSDTLGIKNLGWRIDLHRPVTGTQWSVKQLDIIPATKSSYNWSVSESAGSEYKVRVYLVKNCNDAGIPCREPGDVLPGGTSDASDNYFSIIGATSTF